MKNVLYEWAVERLDSRPTPDNPDPDIIEVDHFDTFSEALGHLDHESIPHRIVLVRDVIEEGFGIVDRSWCYFNRDDHSLEPEFHYCGDDNEPAGYQVPVRLKAEVERCKS